MRESLIDSAPARPARKRVFIAVNGCHENHMDAALVQRYLGAECQLDVAPDVEHADIILVQGCAVTQHMENESRDMIAHLKQVKRPDAALIVIGCVAKAKPELKTADTDPCISLVNIDSLMNRMDQHARRLAVNELYRKPAEVAEFLAERKAEVFEDYLGVGRRRVFRGFSSAVFRALFRGVQRYKDFFESRMDICSGKTYAIKICTGCVGECTYCSVRLSRGTVRSKTIEEVLAEFQRGLRQGYRQFAILGTDIGDYGKDIGLDLTDLLRKLVAVPGSFRLRLRNVNPRWVVAQRAEFCDLLESGKISYLQVAIQSGNDRILGLMKRGYRAKELMDAVAEIRRRCPSLVLRTQIIAGFPTETEEEFQDSVAVIQSNLFDYADFFRYTRRLHTPAAALGPEVPLEVIMRRYRKLLWKALFRHPWQKVRAIRRLRASAPAGAKRERPCA